MLRRRVSELLDLAAAGVGVGGGDDDAPVQVEGKHLLPDLLGDLGQPPGLSVHHHPVAGAQLQQVHHIRACYIQLLTHK